MCGFFIAKKFVVPPQTERARFYEFGYPLVCLLFGDISSRDLSRPLSRVSGFFLLVPFVVVCC